MKKTLLLASALLLGTLSLRAQSVPQAQGQPAQGQRGVLWSAWIDGHADELWTDDAPAATKQAVAEYNANKGRGASIRGLRLGGLTAAQIDEVLKKRGFTRHDDVIRDSKTHDPILGPDHQPVPQLAYTHDDDGALVRLKPIGDPTSKIRPQPDVMKAVRSPSDGDYRDFDQEAFKVEAAGDRAIPKWPKEIKNPYKGTALENAFLDGWGDAAHGDVKAVGAEGPIPK